MVGWDVGFLIYFYLVDGYGYWYLLFLVVVLCFFNCIDVGILLVMQLFGYIFLI